MISAYLVKRNETSLVDSVLFEIEAKNGQKVVKSELGYHCFIKFNGEL